MPNFHQASGSKLGYVWIEVKESFNFANLGYVWIEVKESFSFANLGMFGLKSRKALILQTWACLD